MKCRLVRPCLFHRGGGPWPRLHHSEQGSEGLETTFRGNTDIVDIDTSVEADAPREVVAVDRERAAKLEQTQASISQDIRTALTGDGATYLMEGRATYAVPVRLRLPAGDQASMQQLLALRVRSQSGALVPLSEVVHVEVSSWENAIYHKDLLPYAYVICDDAGRVDSPLYGLFSLVNKLRHDKVAGETMGQQFIAQPMDASDVAVKWDGEWQIAYETFRDMGLACSVGLMLIHLLVVGRFKSYGTHCVDWRGGHGRWILHHRRPDLPGAGRVADFRHTGVYLAYLAGHSRPVLRVDVASTRACQDVSEAFAANGVRLCMSSHAPSRQTLRSSGVLFNDRRSEGARGDGGGRIA